jgi:beta-xylosidase
MLALSACSGDNGDEPVNNPSTGGDNSSTTTTETADLDSFVDNYVDIAGWENRKKWNLANVHDPSVMLADDGYYYMYQTDASYGNAHTGHGHFHCRRSKDLVTWEYLGGTMPKLPNWVNTKLNEIRAEMGLAATNPSESDYGFWAPCVRKVKSGLYRMYYSLVVPGYIGGDKNSWGERAFIGVMETSDPSSNTWTDKGYVITNASDKGLNYNVPYNSYESCYYRWNAIDPTFIIDNDGKHWLIYGSWHSGIVAVELDPSTGKVKADLPACFGTEDDIAAYGQRVFTRTMTSRWQGSEGPEVVYHDGYYYLFMAFDELSVAYNTRVVRSTSITGPYLDIAGTDCTNKGGDAYPVVTHPYKFKGDQGWVGFSHCAVFDDGQGNWYYASQARFPANYGGNSASNALMMGHVHSIRWTEDGWPLVMPERYGAVAQTAIAESELVGEWEHISIQYTYGKQCTSVSLVLGSDHKVTSGWNEGATWSYDASSQVLTIGTQKLYLQREIDWEKSPRTATIVYAGYDTYKSASTRYTYWGKKN